ncbi:reverse transcriptase domain-containing protein [Tanacetum coccineum]
MPKALISDRGTHFYNKIMEKTMKRYGVNHRFSTSYHPQTSGQVENTVFGGWPIGGRHVARSSWQQDEEIKKLIVELLLLTIPHKEETLYVYLAVATEAMSAVLLTERNRKQCPIHYVSRTLNEAEKNYAPLEKLTLSLVHMSRRLRQYFEAHPIKFITDQPIKKILNKAQASGKLARTTQRDGPFSQMGRRIVKVPGWYEALLAGLCMAAKMKVQEIDVKVDSKLVASQINGSYVVSSTSMIKYLATAKECIARFKSFTIHNIPKNSNQKADVLSKLATIAFEHLTKKVLVEVLSERSTDRKELNAMVKDEEDNWMTPIIKCLREGVWPEDKAEARALRMKINQYVLEEGFLFKKAT